MYGQVRQRIKSGLPHVPCIKTTVLQTAREHALTSATAAGVVCLGTHPALGLAAWPRRQIDSRTYGALTAGGERSVEPSPMNGERSRERCRGREDVLRIFKAAPPAPRLRLGPRLESEWNGWGGGYQRPGTGSLAVAGRQLRSRLPAVALRARRSRHRPQRVACRNGPGAARHEQDQTVGVALCTSVAGKDQSYRNFICTYLAESSAWVMQASKKRLPKSRGKVVPFLYVSLDARFGPLEYPGKSSTRYYSCGFTVSA